MVTITGCLSRAAGLRIALDPEMHEEELPIAKMLKDAQRPLLVYQDANPCDTANSLTTIIGNLPMFVNELSWIAQVVHDFGSILEVSPIVHCELAGRGIERANGRAM